MGVFIDGQTRRSIDELLDQVEVSLRDRELPGVCIKHNVKCKVASCDGYGNIVHSGSRKFGRAERCRDYEPK